MRQSQIDARNKYDKEHYDHIHLLAPLGMKDELKKAAELRGISVNAYIIQAIQKEMRGE